MKHFIFAFVVFHIYLLLLGKPSKASPLDNYSEKDSIDEDGIALLPGLEEYMDNDVEDEGLVLAFPDIQKRKSSVYKYRKLCVPRGGNCDHRPKYCCNSGSCRCNLWGANCKCQRMGFFQRWGK